MGPFDELLLDVTVEPGDADLALRDRQHAAGAERELRPRADGAVHARRLGRSGYPVLGGRRARAGPRAHRLGRRLGGRRRPASTSDFDPKRHDTGPKTIFGQTGAFNWTDSCRLCVKHSAHKTFFVKKLWSYFIPVPPSPKTRKALERLYVKRGYAVRPVVEAILMHPTFYRGPAMVKPPIVYIAGLLRARRRGIAERLVVDVPTWRASGCSGRPNVSGWNDDRWLDTSTFRGRWTAANEIAGYDAIDDEASYNATETPKAAVRKARQVLGQPAAQPPDDQDAWSATRAPSAPPRPPTGSRTRSGCCARTRCGCWSPPVPRCRRAEEAEDGLQPLRGVQPLAPDAPSGGRGRPRVAVDRAGDAAARRHRAQPALVHAPLERRDALRLRGLEAAASPSSRRGSPRRPAATTGSWSRSSSTAGSIRSRCSRRPPTRSTARCARRWRWPRARGRRSPRIRACAGTRPPPRSTPCTGRARCRCSRGSATTSPDQSHFTSRHYWEVGALRPNEVTGWMGRLIDTIGTRTTRFRGSRSTARCRRRWRPARSRWRRSTGPSYDLWAKDVWGQPEELMYGAVGELGRAARPDQGRRDEDRGRRRRPGDGAEGAAAAVLRRGDRAAGRLSRGRGRVVRREPLGAGGDARTRACRSAARRSRRRAGSTPTTTRPRASTPTSGSRPTRSPPSRPTSRRAGSPTG